MPQEKGEIAMPNWCANDVSILGLSDNPEEFQKFLVHVGLDTEEKREQATQSEAEFNLFNRLVPMPASLKDTTRATGMDEEFTNAMQGNKDYEYTNWYDWSLANWGTKWDVDPRHVSLVDNCLELSYDTAWSPANHVWEQVTTEFPSLLNRVNYLEEGMGFMGQAWYTEGECTKDDYLDISLGMYAAAGCVIGSDGEIDWDESDAYDLYQLFEHWDEWMTKESK
jgi:hypothetical protein